MNLGYVLYIILFETLILGGCGYAVFVLGYSGWWFVLAMYLSCSAYKPEYYFKYEQKKEK